MDCDESGEVTDEDFVDICLVINYFYLDDYYKNNMTSGIIKKLYGITCE